MSSPVDEACDILEPLGDKRTPAEAVLWYFLSTSAFRNVTNARKAPRYTSEDLDVANAIMDHLAEMYLYAVRAKPTNSTDTESMTPD